MAEKYVTDSAYDPGTVLVFGGSHEVTSSTTYADPCVAGIVSTQPAYLMNSSEENGQPMVLAGRAPCKVVGPIQPGDLLTTSSITGRACKLDPQDWVPGVIIGKALSSCKEGEHLIEIVVGPC